MRDVKVKPPQRSFFGGGARLKSVSSFGEGLDYQYG